MNISQFWAGGGISNEWSQREQVSQEREAAIERASSMSIKAWADLPRAERAELERLIYGQPLDNRRTPDDK